SDLIQAGLHVFNVDFILEGHIKAYRHVVYPEGNFVKYIVAVPYRYGFFMYLLSASYNFKKLRVKAGYTAAQLFTFFDISKFCRPPAGVYDIAVVAHKQQGGLRIVEIFIQHTFSQKTAHIAFTEIFLRFHYGRYIFQQLKLYIFVIDVKSVFY